MSRPGWVTWAGLAVVLLAAAVLSFAALRDLGVAVRISDRLAWLLPIAVDAGAAVSCSAWLSPRSSPEVARFARSLTWALLTLTVAGNAASQGMAAAAITPPWWAAVLVGAIPPAVVGGVVHLAVLVGRSRVGVSDVPEPQRLTRDRPAVGGPAVTAPKAAPKPPAPGLPNQAESVGPSMPLPGRAVTPPTAPRKASTEPATAPPRPVLALAPNSDPTPPRGVPVVDGRAEELVAAGLGRKRLARELGVSEHEARALLARARA